MIYDPKPRLIVCAPVPDRVVHTALVMLAEPFFLRRATADAFACRPGFGTHRAVLALQRCMRKHRFAVHLDIRAYFPSVHLPTLKGLLATSIRDARFLSVLDLVLVAGSLYFIHGRSRKPGMPVHPWSKDRGLPIGALTSQLFAAHVYLSGLDHFIKRTLKISGYVRYMDDLFCFANRRTDLRAARSAIQRWLADERRLELKHPNARVLAAAGHIDGLGYRIRRDRIEVLPRTLKRIRRRIHLAINKEMSITHLSRSMASATAAALF